MLAAEIAQLRAFEAKATRPAASHLRSAREDLEYERDVGTIGCWADDDPAFAAKHIEMARENVLTDLKELGRLGPGLHSLKPSAVDPAKAAAFRLLVRNLIDAMTPLCGPPRAYALMTELDSEVARLRDRLASTDFAVHFAVAEADAKTLRSQTTAECADPGSETPQTVEAFGVSVLRTIQTQSAKIAAAAAAGV
ncbi:MAG: hypothetical protein EOP62_17055 [Sphingomonadales bacterium]|nr:MAG: hypothetical protein EOP62_17055 [Sphingomonadales bacterium]